MKYSEALAWLRGERTCINAHIAATDYSQRGECMANCAIEDAATTQQAYWMVRAHKEQLAATEVELAILRAELADEVERLKIGEREQQAKGMEMLLEWIRADIHPELRNDLKEIALEEGYIKAHREGGDAP